MLIKCSVDIAKGFCHVTWHFKPMQSLELESFYSTPQQQQKNSEKLYHESAEMFVLYITWVVLHSCLEEGQLM